MMEKSTFEEQLEKYGQLCYPNVGVSMMPLLRQGRDLMVIQRQPCRRYDAVLFRRPGVAGRGAYVLHRILRCNDDGTYWIVGDNCVTGETVRQENILGVLTAVVRDGKKTVKVTDPAMRVYVFLWGRLYPIRIAALRMLHLAGRVLRKLGLRK